MLVAVAGFLEADMMKERTSIKHCFLEAEMMKKRTSIKHCFLQQLR